MLRYDLHTHSVYSDGTTVPGEIAREAAAVGLAGFALTDHDTTEGWSEARIASAEAGVDFLPGIEVTTRDEWRSTHLLGYGIDPEHSELAEALARVRRSRVARAKEMVRRLSADYDITWEAVIGDAAGAAVLPESFTPTVGRPHIADALVAAGYFPDRGAAFAEVLRPGSRYYVPTYAIETVDAIGMVREAGGIPVLAHPAADRHSRSVDVSALERFGAAGLWGIELDHPENRPEWIPELERFAAGHGLRLTGASDYHGAGKPNRLGERSSAVGSWEEIRSLVAVPR